MMLTAFKNAYERDIIKVIQEMLLSLDAAYRAVETESVWHYAECCIRYMQATHAEITEEVIKEQLNKLDGKGKQVMDLFERREQIGLKQGRVEGLAEGQADRLKIATVVNKLLMQGKSVDEIMRVTALPKQKILDIKDSLNI